MAGETAERTLDIDAPPSAVWAVLGDVRRMPEWSEDLESVELLSGDGRSADSRFRGNNRSGSRAWSMTCVIDRYDDEQRLEFHTENPQGEARTKWWYRIEPVGAGTRVTEGFLRVAELSRVRVLAERKIVGDRTEYNERNIDASLQRLASLIVAPTSG
jgi:uncharacterized protein YndB with AHSA1/START domain